MDSPSGGVPLTRLTKLLDSLHQIEIELMEIISWHGHPKRLSAHEALAFVRQAIAALSGELHHSGLNVAANARRSALSRLALDSFCESVARFWLLPVAHHLIPVIILSSKIPLTGRVFKESVKVCTPKSPSSADDAPFDLAALDVFAYRPGIQPEHFRCLP